MNETYDKEVAVIVDTYGNRSSSVRSEMNVYPHMNIGRLYAVDIVPAYSPPYN